MFYIAILKQYCSFGSIVNLVSCSCIVDLVFLEWQEDLMWYVANGFFRRFYTRREDRKSWLLIGPLDWANGVRVVSIRGWVVFLTKAFFEFIGHVQSFLAQMAVLVDLYKCNLVSPKRWWIIFAYLCFVNVVTLVLSYIFYMLLVRIIRAAQDGALSDLNHREIKFWQACTTPAVRKCSVLAFRVWISRECPLATFPFCTR